MTGVQTCALPIWTLSGIVHDDDVDWMDETARIVLGDDDVDTLVELLTEAVVLPSQ